MYDEKTKKLIAAFMAKYRHNKVPVRMRTQLKTTISMV